MIKFLTFFLYIYSTLKRNKLVRMVAFWLLTGCLFVGFMFGWQVLFYVVTMASRILFGFMFMIVQFLGLFWFISRVKATEIHPGDEKIITMDDYWGNHHIVDTMLQWNKILVGQSDFKRIGGVALNGILMIGPPGTGKTMLAKVLAGEGGAAFYGMEGSNFRAMFWGVDTLKVMGFFKRCRALAKDYGACIGFLDELDSIGMSRGGVAGGGGRMSGMMGMGGSGALTRLLYELDGIEEIPLWDQCENKVRRLFGLPEIEQGKILIMGATNRPDVLDPALLRPGRFDEKVYVGLPDSVSRREIIEGYLGKIDHEEIDVDSLVQDTPWASPAQIASAFTKTAVRIAVFRDHERVTQRDIEDALQEQALGLENPILDLEPEQKYQIAVHEAAHAIVQHYLMPEERIVRVSIVRRSSALGYVLPVSKTDIYTIPLDRLVRKIMVALAGHVGVELVLGKPWTGAAGDLNTVYRLIEVLANHAYFGGLPEFTDCDRVIEKFLESCREKLRQLLMMHKDALMALVDVLLEEENLAGTEVVSIIQEFEDEEEDTE